MLTGTIEIRLLARHDAPVLDRAVTESLEHLRPWMRWVAEEPKTLAEREALIATWAAEAAAGHDRTFGIFLDDGTGGPDAGRTLIGGCGLHRRLGPGGLEIGYWLHVDHTGRGYMTRVAGALTTLAFADPDITHVEIHHDVANPRSGRVPERLGYTMVGERQRPPLSPAETDHEFVWRQWRDRWAPPA